MTAENETPPQGGGVDRPERPENIRRERRSRRFAKGLDTPRRRLRAWLNALFVDHQILRFFYPNRWRLGAKAWRSGQPSPAQIRAFARAGGRTVVNLRGESEFGSYALEREAVDKAGLVYREFKLRSRNPPRPEKLLAAAAFFDSLEYPALFHCKSGADRAGLASALYLLLHEGRPLEEARAQLHWRFGHFSAADTGVLDRIFEEYAKAQAGTGVSFPDWVRDSYDPVALKRDFHADRRVAFLVDRVLGRE